MQNTANNSSIARDETDVAIVGGGILGLAVAWELAGRFPDLRIDLLEKEPAVAGHQTGHNSGVIHSGIYYRPGSEKARLCVDGARRMKEFCSENAIPYRDCGKLIVATAERELPGLEELHRRGQANGVPGVELVGPERMRELEPEVAGLRAVRVPGAAIVDYKAVSARLSELCAERGVAVRTSCRFDGGAARNGGLTLETGAGDLHARHLINCGGLQADRIARRMGDRVALRIVPFRGEYYELAERSRHLVNGLIYPVPDPRLPFLGVHLTSRIDGSVEAGPNAVLALHREGYKKGMFSVRDMAESLCYPGFWKMATRWWRTGVSEMRRSYSKRVFLRDLQRLVPAITADDLATGGAGVRAQAVDTSGKLLDDFAILDGPRALHVCNAPSPAATASLAIASEITNRAAASFRLA